jgi:hypothetical protein
MYSADAETVVSIPSDAFSLEQEITHPDPDAEAKLHFKQF